MNKKTNKNKQTYEDETRTRNKSNKTKHNTKNEQMKNIQ